ncbi:cytochrome P450 family protein [Marssonina coronariae]|uniref:Cytochrome P450 family protein n=1 Tax=Diplocarpon coronariae TaxID=2795749 RepID=A0A218Z6B3_9HELO|nr:cytochrome P450 family protein [Marssonina coronariae]
MPLAAPDLDEIDDFPASRRPLKDLRKETSVRVMECRKAAWEKQRRQAAYKMEFAFAFLKIWRRRMGLDLKNRQDAGQRRNILPGMSLFAREVQFNMLLHGTVYDVLVYQASFRPKTCAKSTVDSRPLPSGFIACHEHVDRATLGERAAAESPVVIRRRAALHSGHDDQKRAEHVNGDDTPTPYRAPQSSVLGGHRASARPLFPAWRPRSSLSVKGTAGSRR